MAQGLSDCEIAAKLSLSEHTVGYYLKIIFRRNGLHSRTTLAARLLARQQVSNQAGILRARDTTNVGIARDERAD